jgi:hypothetical protein
LGVSNQGSLGAHTGPPGVTASISSERDHSALLSGPELVLRAVLILSRWSPANSCQPSDSTADSRGRFVDQAVTPVFTAYRHSKHNDDPDHTADEHGEYDHAYGTGHGGLQQFHPADSLRTSRSPASGFVRVFPSPRCSCGGRATDRSADARPAANHVHPARRILPPSGSRQMAATAPSRSPEAGLT